MVAQLGERSRLTPEIRGLNPNIGKFYLPIVNLNRSDENKEKEPEYGPSFKRRPVLKRFGHRHLKNALPSKLNK